MFDYTLSFKLNWKIFECIGTNHNQFHTGRAVGSRKLFYGGGGDRGGWREGWVKMSAIMVGWKIEEKALAKTPENCPKKVNLNQNANDSKAHTWSFFKKTLFRAYTFKKKSIIRSLFIFNKLRKMASDFFNNYIFINIFSEHHQSFFFFDFRFSSWKSPSQ